MCPSHFLHKGGGGGTNIFNTWRGDKHFYIHGGQTFSSSGGSGNDDFDCDEEEDVSIIFSLFSSHRLLFS